MRGALDCVSAKISPTESTEVFTIHSYSAPDLSDQKRDVESQSDQFCTNRFSFWWLFGVDLPLLFIVLALIGLFELGVIPSNKGGFYCNDPAIMFPYTEETVTTSILMTGLLVMPILVFMLTELIFTTDTNVKWLQTFKNSCWLYRSYVYGLLMNLCIIEVMKGIVGGPRPSFMDLCKPNVVCNGTEFVRKFECTSTYSRWEQMDSYRSFPSGHTSLSVYCSFFVAWYLQMRAFNWRYRSVLVVPFAQLLLISFAIVSSLTRITDHRHHWWDVLTGSAVGVITLLYAVFCLCNNFSSSNEEQQSTEEDSRKTTKTLLFDEQRS